MEDIIANIDDIRFDIEVALEEQIGIQPLPFPGMDKSAAAICDFYIANRCTRGQLCPLRHVRGNQMVVCKHWLRGLCKKGDDCEFLHKYDMERMPECYFFIKYGQCSNKECPFLHLNPADRIKDCPWYDRGFCKHGPHCKNRHVRRVMCVNYMCGFCPDGSKCKLSHPRYEIQLVEDRKPYAHIVCHACGEQGHKSTHCAVARRLAAEAAMRGEPIPDFNLEQPPTSAVTSQSNPQPQPPQMNPIQLNPHSVSMSMPHHQGAIPVSAHFGQPINSVLRPVNAIPAGSGAAFVPFGKRPLEFVTCFKCRGKGHYANRCPFSANQRPPGGFPNPHIPNQQLEPPPPQPIYNPQMNGHQIRPVIETHPQHIRPDQMMGPPPPPQMTQPPPQFIHPPTMSQFQHPPTMQQQFTQNIPTLQPPQPQFQMQPQMMQFTTDARQQHVQQPQQMQQQPQPMQQQPQPMQQQPQPMQQQPVVAPQFNNVVIKEEQNVGQPQAMPQQQAQPT